MLPANKDDQSIKINEPYSKMFVVVVKKLIVLLPVDCSV